jgi:phthalate 3,4-dioxygenase ferredoxin reductase subunit
LPYTPVDYIWTDQFDWRLQVIGKVDVGCEGMRIEAPGRKDGLLVLYGHDSGMFTGAVVLNWPRATLLCRKALDAGTSLADVRKRFEG